MKITTTAFIFHKDKVLFVYHKKKDRWMHVGGHLEKEEDFDEALKREIKEETNLEVEILSDELGIKLPKQLKKLKRPFFLHKNPIANRIALDYICRAKKPINIKLQEEEILDYKWVTEEEVRNLDTPQTIKKLAIRAFKKYKEFKKDEVKEIGFENSKGKKVEGNLHLSEKDTSSIVILAHGFTSNKNRDRYISIGKKLNKEGIDFLRFNFGGSGNSYETEIDIDKQVDDLSSAIEFAKNKDYKRISLLGESLGGLISLRTINNLSEDDLNNLKSLVLWAPVTHSKTPTYLKENLETSKKLEDKGFVIKHKDGKDFKLPKKYFEDRKNVNQNELLANTELPILILHGNEDKIIPLEHSKKAEEKRENIELEIIDKASHIGVSESEKTHKLTINWFKKYLK